MFDDETYPAEELADQADLFAAFTGVNKTIQPRDRIFLVMGMTGAGKSTFINRCTGKNVTVGHSLYSCKCACKDRDSRDSPLRNDVTSFLTNFSRHKFDRRI
jgi:ABC-type multidrug transport system ATPase subunit